MGGPAVAEAPKLQTVVPPSEKYASSASKWRQIGAVAAAGEVELGNSEIAEIQALVDCISSLVEMIKTDEEFGKHLVIEGSRTYGVSEGKVVDIDGKPIVDMIQGGSIISQALAKIKPEYAGQAERDQGDVETANKVDRLKPGQSMFVLSMIPKKDMEEHFKTYHGLGYREGLSYWQHYSKTEDGTVVAGWHSIDKSDEQALRELFAEEGVHIPENESHNKWILHDIKRDMSPEQAKAFVVDLTERYNNKAGLETHKLSASEFVESNRELVEHIFRAYYPSLGKAMYTGRNNEVMQSFANAMLKTDLNNMNSSIRMQLIKIANSRKFNDENGRTMDSVIRYAIVEELRKGLDALVNKRVEVKGLATVEYTVTSAVQSRSGSSTSDFDQNSLNALMAGNVSRGVKARRNYGGCANVDLGGDNVFSINAAATSAIDAPKGALQEAFAGYGKSEKDRIGEERMDKCVVPACPNGKKVVKVGGCGVCLERCQPIFDAGGDPTTEPAPEVRNDREQEPGIDSPEEGTEELAEAISSAELRDVNEPVETEPAPENLELKTGQAAVAAALTEV